MASLPMVASGGGEPNIGCISGTAALTSSDKTFNVSGMSKIYAVAIGYKSSSAGYSSVYKRNNDDTATKVADLTTAFSTYGRISNIYDTSFVARWNASVNATYVAIGELS